MNKRSHRRKTVAKIGVEISDGANVFPGTVKNISDFGLVIDTVSPGLDHRSELLSINLLSEGRAYHLRAFPRWVSENDRNKTIGVRVFSAPRSWYKFVDAL